MGSTVLTALTSLKRRVDQHPAVTAVPEKPRAPIVLDMRLRIELQSGLTFPQAHSKLQPHAKNAAVLQLFACGPVLYPLYWAARSQLGTRSICDTRPRL